MSILNEFTLNWRHSLAFIGLALTTTGSAALAKEAVTGEKLPHHKEATAGVFIGAAMMATALEKRGVSGNAGVDTPEMAEQPAATVALEQHDPWAANKRRVIVETVPQTDQAISVPATPEPKWSANKTRADAFKL